MQPPARLVEAVNSSLAPSDANLGKKECRHGMIADEEAKGKSRWKEKGARKGRNTASKYSVEGELSEVTEEKWEEYAERR